MQAAAHQWSVVVLPQYQQPPTGAGTDANAARSSGPPLVTLPAPPSESSSSGSETPLFHTAHGADKRKRMQAARMNSLYSAMGVKHVQLFTAQLSNRGPVLGDASDTAEVWSQRSESWPGASTLSAMHDDHLCVILSAYYCYYRTFLMWYGSRVQTGQHLYTYSLHIDILSYSCRTAPFFAKRPARAQRCDVLERYTMTFLITLFLDDGECTVQ